MVQELQRNAVAEQNPLATFAILIVVTSWHKEERRWCGAQCAGALSGQIVQMSVYFDFGIFLDL